MNSFIVIARFLPGTVMADVLAIVAEEQAAAARLASEGRLGSIHVSMPRQTVFLEVFAEDADAAAATVGELPMARWWELDVYPTPDPR